MVVLPDGRPAVGRRAVVYADEAATAVATIGTYQPTNPAVPGPPIPGGVVTIDGFGLLPRFWFPDGVDRLWVRANGGPAVPVDADNNARIDAVEAAKVSLSPAGLQQLETQRVAALRTWHTGLAGRHFEPVRIAAVGSSTTEGMGQTTYARTLMVRLLGQLRARFPVPGVTGGENYVAAYGQPGWTWPVARSAGTTTAQPGWGLKSVNLFTTAHTLTYTFTGTSFHIWYSQYGGGGIFSVEVDGTVVAAAVSSGGALDRNATWTSAPLAAGSHTVVVRFVSGGEVFIHGFATFNGDEQAGIQLYNGGQSSRTSGDFASNTSFWVVRAATIQPHLVLLQLGVNDAFTGVAPATMKANLQTVIAAVRANCATNPSFVIYGSPKVGGATAFPWDAYQQVWRELAAEDTAGIGGTSLIAYWDLGLRHVSPTVDNTPGLYNPDMTHLTDRGAVHVADALAAFLAP